MSYKAEYIWIDGTEPTRSSAVEDQDPRGRRGACRSGASTVRAPTRRPGSNSDCVLQPVFVVPGPDPRRRRRARDVRGAAHRHDAAPDQHPRRCCAPIAEKYADQEPLFGIEQEYTFFKDGRPLGFPPNGFPAPQGFYYCGVGADEVFGRDVVEAHLEACLDAGLGISGINAEVMPGQWEFQVGPLEPARRVRPAVGRPLAALPHRRGLRRRRPRSTRSRSRATGTAPARTPTSRPRRCARATTRSSPRARRSASKAEEHVDDYGAGIEHRLTGSHETAPWTEFSYGVSDRGASVRIPWQVEIDKKGYIEDRRPNANMDPYVVTRLITETVCSALAWSDLLRHRATRSASVRSTRGSVRGQDLLVREPGLRRPTRHGKGGESWRLPVTS